MSAAKRTRPASNSGATSARASRRARQSALRLVSWVVPGTRPPEPDGRPSRRSGSGAAQRPSDAITPRVTSDFEESKGADEPVPGRVLDALCHDRAAQLLKADDSLASG